VIQSIESKTRRELVEIVKIQIEEFQKQNKELESLREQLATTKAEIVSVSDKLVSAKSDGIREAISATRKTVKYGGLEWLCKVYDLTKYADQLKQTNNESGEG